MQVRSSQVAFKDISKDTFSKFKKVRIMKSALMGQYWLYSKDSIKYMVKQLNSNKQFLTCRPGCYSFSRYTCPNSAYTSYIYPIIGVGLQSCVRSSNSLTLSKASLTSNSLNQNTLESKQFKTWLSRNNNSFQKCLKQLLKFFIKLSNQNKQIRELHLECLRLVNGEIVYCYDTWMNKSQNIVLTQNNLIENLLFSLNQLTLIKQQILGRKQINLQQILTFNTNFYKAYFNEQNTEVNFLYDFYFKACLLVLNVGSMQLNLRNYQWGQFSHNFENIKKRLHYFKLRFNKQKLGDLLQKVLLSQMPTQSQVSMFIHEINQSLKQDQSKQNKQSRLSLNSTGSKFEFQQSGKKLIHLSNGGNVTPKPRVSMQKQFADRSGPILFTQGLKQSNCVFELFNEESNILKSHKFSQSKSSASKLNKSFNSQYKGGNNIRNKQNIQTKQTSSNIKAPQRVKLGKDKVGSYQISKKFNGINLRSLFQQISLQNIGPNTSNLNLLHLLNLQQCIPSSQYQKNLLTHLSNAYIKPSYQKVVKSNSIYFGELQIQNINGQQREIKEGQGIYLFPSQDLYIGQWKDNHMHGYGTYIFQTAELYQGSLIQGKKSGYGTFFYSNRTKYQGFWQDGHKSGLGTVTFPNGIRFFGQFSTDHQDSNTSGVFTGYEKSTKQTWSKNGFLSDYDAEKKSFKKSKYAKQSNQFFSFKCSENEQDQNDAYFRNIQLVQDELHSQRNGFGREQNHETIFQGHFLNNQRHGTGKLIVINKYEIKGQWKNGLMISYQSTQS